MLKYFITYSIISIFILLIISSVSYKLNLVDYPNQRKKHLKPTAYTGGIALSIIYILSILIFDVHGQKLNQLLSISFLISIVGFIDDKYNLNIGGKLSLQIIPIIYLIIFENLRLIELGNYDFFRMTLSSFSIPFTLICTLFLINSFNYFDGLDGILCSTSISILAILFFLVSDQNIQYFLICLFIPIVIFLFFNFSIFNLPKLFLGDSGSLLLGTIIAFVLIYFEMNKITHPILLAWSISIFVYEFLSINLIRLKNNKYIFEPGFDHLHHIIFKKFKSIFLTNLTISFLNIIFFICGYLSFQLINPLASLIFFIFLFVIYFLLRLKFYFFYNSKI